MESLIPRGYIDILFATGHDDGSGAVGNGMDILVSEALSTAFTGVELKLSKPASAWAAMNLAPRALVLLTTSCALLALPL